MSNTPRKHGTYYDRTREARRAYQKAYYEAKKHDISRARQLEAELYPERHAERKAKSLAHYYAKRKEILAKRREKYRQDHPESGDLQG